jgi:ribonuclease-3
LSKAIAAPAVGNEVFKEQPRSREICATHDLDYVPLSADLSEFETRIGYSFQSRELLTRALTHKSYSHEAKNGVLRDNETFEFLGDAVLGFVIGDLLFRRFPELDEGAMSKMKAYLVSATSLAEKARAFGMGDVLFLGVGEEKSGGRKKDSLLANLFEAMLAAVYLDGGIDAVRGLIERSFTAQLEGIDEQDLLFQDYKTALQELAQGRGLPLPEYSVVDEVGPDHDKRFIVEVKVGSLVTRGEGSSKKEAQQQAAKHALRESSPAE